MSMHSGIKSTTDTFLCGRTIGDRYFCFLALDNGFIKIGSRVLLFITFHIPCCRQRTRIHDVDKKDIRLTSTVNEVFVSPQRYVHSLEHSIRIHFVDLLTLRPARFLLQKHPARNVRKCCHHYSLKAPSVVKVIPCFCK